MFSSESAAAAASTDSLAINRLGVKTEIPSGQTQFNWSVQEHYRFHQQVAAAYIGDIPVISLSIFGQRYRLALALLKRQSPLPVTRGAEICGITGFSVRNP